MYFQYSEEELQALKAQDLVLARLIDEVGLIERKVIPNLYHALVNSIIGQQISTKAHQTVWQRFLVKFNPLTPELIINSSIEDIQECGLTFRKANYIKEMSFLIISKELDLTSLPLLDDETVIKELIKIKGIGKWTVEMIMIFSMQRKNILSWDDLAIRRGIKLLYQKEDLSKEEFLLLHERYSPYASIASLYLWHLAGQK
jgi:DNA-3-methyladenine glycosylase II